MSLLRVPLALTSVVALHTSFSNPNKSVSNEEVTKYANAEAPAWLFVPVSWKVYAWTSLIGETAVVASSHLPPSPVKDLILRTLVPRPSWAISAIQVTPTFLAGCLLTVAGSYLRLSCFRTLGGLFTFHLSIREERKLVTSGPYAYVRHPAYTGGVMAAVGTVVCFLGEGSWLRECGWLDGTGGKAVVGVAASLLALTGVFVTRRSIMEDRKLRQAFGEQWDSWASNVPYRFIPYII